MKHKAKGKRLTLDEGMAILGAEQPERITNIRLDPISLRVIASRIGERLVSKGGRPTDSSWELDRKVPMRVATWSRLKQLAGALSKQQVRVAPGQLAAVALERGLPTLTSADLGQEVAAMARTSIFAAYQPDPESEKEARQLCEVISERGLW